MTLTTERKPRELNRSDEIIAHLREHVPAIVGENNGDILIAQGNSLITLNNHNITSSHRDLLVAKLQSLKIE